MDAVAVVGAPVACRKSPADIIVKKAWVVPVLAAWPVSAPPATLPVFAFVALVSGAVHP